MKRIDQEGDDTWISAALYGHPGTGKTSFGVSAPKPLILLSERQGKAHVQEAAARLGKPMPPVLYMETLQDYRDVLIALKGSRSEPLRVYATHHNDEGKPERVLMAELEWPETIVIDSLTDCGQLVVDGIREQSPPRAGSDGLPVVPMNHWQVLGDRMRGILRGFRDLPMHNIFLCLADDREVGEGADKKRELGPDLPMRKLSKSLAASVNVIGYTYRKEIRKSDEAVKQSYGVMLSGPEYMLLKRFLPLRETEVPDFSKWVEIIRGKLSQLPEPPSPSQESLASTVEEPAQEAPRAKPVDEQEEPKPKTKTKTKVKAAAKEAS